MQYELPNDIRLTSLRSELSSITHDCSLTIAQQFSALRRAVGSNITIVDAPSQLREWEYVCWDYAFGLAAIVEFRAWRDFLVPNYPVSRYVDFLSISFKNPTLLVTGCYWCIEMPGVHLCMLV